MYGHSGVKLILILVDVTARIGGSAKLDYGQNELHKKIQALVKKIIKVKSRPELPDHCLDKLGYFLNI